MRGNGSSVKNSLMMMFLPGFPASGNHVCVSPLMTGNKTTNLDGKHEELPRGEAPSASHAVVESFPGAGRGVHGGLPEPRALCPSWEGTGWSRDGTTRCLRQLCAVAACLLHGVATGRGSAVVTAGSCCFGDLQSRNISYAQKNPKKNVSHPALNISGKG